MNEESILTFIDEELKSNQNVIEDFDLAQLHNLIGRHEFVLVYLCKYTKRLLLEYRAECFIQKGFLSMWIFYLPDDHPFLSP